MRRPEEELGVEVSAGLSREPDGGDPARRRPTDSDRPRRDRGGAPCLTPLSRTRRPPCPSQSRRARQDAGLFERYHRTRDLEVRAELVARLLPLAKRLARRYGDRDEYDDLVQVASFALIKAIDRYDPGRGTHVLRVCRADDRGRAQALLPRPWLDRARSARAARSRDPGPARVGAADGTARAIAHAAEIAEALECSVERVLEALQTESAQRPDRLDAPTDPDDDDRERPTVASEEPGYAIAEASATLAPLLAAADAAERTDLDACASSTISRRRRSDR